MTEPLLPAAQVFKRYLPTTQNWIYEQFRALREFRPVVLAQTSLNLEQFPVERIVTSRSANPLQRALDKLRRRVLGYEPAFGAAVRAENARLIHAHFGGRGAASVDLARALDVPLLVSFYGFDLWRDHGDPARLKARYARLFEHCTFAIAEGAVARRRLVELGCPEAKARIHRLSIDLTQLRYADRARGANVRVLVVARFTEKKGLPLGLEAFCRAAAKETTLQLTVVGDADESEAEQRIKAGLRETVKAHRMQDRVQFAGQISPPELRRLLYEHDLLIQPSIRASDGDAEGGLPVILLEAAATGMPLIASNHCDIPDIVIDGHSGWLCKEHDIAGLEAALLSAARDPVQRASFGRNARKLVEEGFDLSHHTWDGLYREALELKRANGSVAPN